MSNPVIFDLATRIIRLGAEKRIGIATAESCTGGLISGALTDISGSSDVFEGGFITYSYEAKRDILNVPWDLLTKKGAVSGEVAEAMARGALIHMSGRAHVCVAVTGIAGPTGGTSEKPVGLVYFGIGQTLKQNTISTTHEKIVFDEPTRELTRRCAVEHALRLILGVMS